ncbi:MAG: hypothetical protein AB2L18_04500 [Anaerolineaceae bacterium]
MDHEKKEIKEQEDFSEEESLLEKHQISKKKKRRHPLRWIFILILLVAAFLYIQQWYLDLEAEAMIYAQQTASGFESLSTQYEIERPLEVTRTSTQVPPTATDDPNLLYTQTVAAQLTDVAEFQQTPNAE